MRAGALVRRAAALEGAMWRSLYRWVRRNAPPLAPGDVPFGYLGAVKPLLGVFIGLSMPNAGGRPVDEVRLYADDPAGFVTAARSRLAAGVAS
jgi:hypothetical protein